MYYKIICPNAPLNLYVKHYWIMETDPDSGDISERVIPTGNVQLMFHYKNPFVVKDSDCSSVQPRSIISGINNSFFDVSTCGEAGVIAVSFFPLGACSFLDFPLFEIAGKGINLGDILAKEVKLVEAQICNTNVIQEKIQIIEKFLLKRLSPVKNYDFILIQQALTLISRNKGCMNIRNLSESLSATPKNLERKFSALIGATPKQYASLIRFQLIVLDLSRNPKSKLAEMAYKYGYFDQSHFIKDFKSYAGYTPSDFPINCPCGHLEAELNL